MTGQLTHGIYKLGPDEWDDKDPDVLQENLGVDSDAQRWHSTGAGHPSDESDTTSLSSAESDSSISSTSSSQSSESSSPGGADSGSTDSDSDSSERNNTLAIHRAVRSQIRHKAVSIPQHGCPFDDDNCALFFYQLEHATSNQVIPTGFGFHHNEANYAAYQELHHLQVGRNRNRMISVILPQSIWMGRYILWAQAVTGLTINMTAT